MNQPDWYENIQPLPEDLQEFDASGLQTLEGFEPSDEYNAETYGQAVNYDAGVLVRNPNVSCIDATSARSMAGAIGALPDASESLHMWIGGQHSMGHILPAILSLAAPATISTLHIATLTFSKVNAEEWSGLIDAEQIGKMSIVVSVYFEKTSPQIFDPAVALLRPRGVTITTSRCHAKLLCAQLSDGRTITAEGSANTRSAKTLEQVTLFGSPEVYHFHVQQMNRIAIDKGFSLAKAEKHKNENT